MKINIEDGDEALSEKVPKEIGAAKEENGSLSPDLVGEKTIKEPKRKKSRLEKKELPKKKKDEINKLKGIIGNLTEELKLREQEVMDAGELAARSVADADNYKKRLARENKENATYATSSLLQSILPVLDNLDKARDVANNGSGDVEQLSEGVRLTREHLLTILEKAGLKRLDVVGKPFDPAVSEALQMEETTEYDDGTVIKEFLPGYKFKERVIRPAKVSISRNPG